MKVEIGYGDETYGTVEATAKGMQFVGENVEAMQSLLKSVRPATRMSDAEFVASLPNRLHDRLWARNAKEQAS